MAETKSDAEPVADRGDAERKPWTAPRVILSEMIARGVAGGKGGGNPDGQSSSASSS